MSADTSEEHSFEQYKLAVEMADRISARRGLANTFFLTANAGLVALLGNQSVADPVGWAGVAFSVAWWVLLKSYRDLSTAKWKVITTMEGNLPVKPFTEEWELLKKDRVPWWRPRYAELSTVEQLAPVVFVVLFVLGLAGFLN